MSTAKGHIFGLDSNRKFSNKYMVLS